VTLRWLWLGSLALAACTSSKQITLTIDTTAGVPCDIDQIQVRAIAAHTTTSTHSVNGSNLPLTITLSDESADSGFQLEITGLKGTTEVLKTSGMLAFGGEDVVERVVLEPQCTVDAPCDLPDLAPSSVAAPAVLPRYGCGTVTHYSMQAGDAVFFDVCPLTGPNTGKIPFTGGPGAVAISALEDALATSKFRFYGQPIRRIWVDRRGYLSFTQDNPDATDIQPPAAFDSQITGKGLPPPSQSVMVFWDRLTASATGACYALDGEPGIQTLRVTWHGACETSPCTAKTLNFTAVLYEHTQRVDFSYGDMEADRPELARGAAATVGIVNQATGCAVADCKADTGMCSDGKTPCGYTQVFSATDQMTGVADVGFEPVFQ
jgi:hypothetical protein